MKKHNQIDTQESFKRGPIEFFIILCFHYRAEGHFIVESVTSNNSFNNKCPYYLLHSIYRPQGSDWPCYKWISFEWNWNVDSPTIQPVLCCTFLASNKDTNYYGTRKKRQCNTERKIGLKWTCFNTRGRKGVDEEVAFQLSRWEMWVEKNYNSDTHCVRGILSRKGKYQWKKKMIRKWEMLRQKWISKKQREIPI